MTEDLDYSWVSEVSSEIDEMAEFLSGPMRDGEERVASVDYGLDNALESSEKFSQEQGLLTDAESVEGITKYVSEFSLGTITINGPSVYPSTSYQLDLVATQDEQYWEFSSVDANVELNEQNNYIRRLEKGIEKKLEDEDRNIRRLTEDYQSDSQFMKSITKKA